MIVYNNIENGMTDVYLGNKSIAQVYIGSNKVFPSYVPPAAYNRYVYERANGETGVSECNSDSVLDWYELHQADENHDTIVKITVGECIDTIDERGFGYLKVLSTVDMSKSSVVSIGKFAFSP